MICSTCRAALRQSLLLVRPRASLPLARPHTLAPSPIRRFTSSRRLFSAQPEPEPEAPTMSEAEASIAALLHDALAPTQLLVQDISGGCGSMYAIDITSAQFKGQSILKQQRMVNAALGGLVKQWHGVQIRTTVPSDA